MDKKFRSSKKLMVRKTKTDCLAFEVRKKKGVGNKLTNSVVSGSPKDLTSLVPYTRYPFTKRK